MGFNRFDPAAFFAGIQKNEKSVAPPAQAAQTAQVAESDDPTCATFATCAGGALENEKSHRTETLRIHPQLRRALVRELFPADGCRCFLLDTAVKAGVPLVDACPKGIEPTTWREAVMALSESLLCKQISRDYDEQPTLTFVATGRSA
jgi:hypothetical protein